MMRRLCTAFFLFSAAACAWAEPLVYAGRLERLELRPRGAQACPEPCPLTPPRADGMVTVCISNGGGCQSSEFSVHKVFAGNVGPRRTISAGIGEWGRTFVLTNALVLIVEHKGHARWTYAIEREGQVLVRPEKLYSTPPANVQPIGLEETGLVPVEQVLEELRSGS